VTSAIVAGGDTPALGPFAGKRFGWWGMVMMIVTEGTIFALLLFSYFYLRVRADHWPLGNIEKPELKIVSIRTVLLLGSSIPMQFAERAVKRGQRTAMLGYMALAWVMSAIFLAGHVQEQVDSWGKFRPSTNAYGSLFYVIVNLHALHLIIGLAFVMFVFIRGLNDSYSPREHEQVSVTVLYWHFVDAVWIAVFSSLYLSVSLR
jgi:heme/copper-type cytochrome/quinol oxidase subunit 3